MPLSIAFLCVLTQAEEMSFTFSSVWTLGFIILGVVFDVASIFLPWGILASSSTYLYLSGSIVNGEDVLLPEDFFAIMQARAQLITISNLIKAAIIVGCTAVILYWYVERRTQSRMHRRVLSYGVVVASSFLSFMAVAMFASIGFGLSWGAYLALVGGVLMVLGIVMRELRVEVVVEREVSEQGG